MNGGDTRTKRAGARRLHLVDHLHQEQQLAIRGARGGVYGLFIAPIIRQLHLKARINDLLTLLDVLDLATPALAVGRVGEHEIKAFGGKLIAGERGANADVLGVVTLDHHVRFTDRVGLVVDLLAVEIDVAAGLDQAFWILDIVLRFGQHAARPAGRIINRHERG